MSDWQPIETAPRDGSKILAWNGLEVMIIFMMGGEWVNVFDVDCSGNYQTEEPEYWMSLPPAPPELP